MGVMVIRRSLIGDHLAGPYCKFRKLQTAWRKKNETEIESSGRGLLTIFITAELE